MERIDELIDLITHQQTQITYLKRIVDRLEDRVDTLEYALGDDNCDVKKDVNPL